MGKKRRAWWIAGGVATAFALFVLSVFIVDYNSTDARVEREVQRIARQHGFDIDGQELDKRSNSRTDLIIRHDFLTAEEFTLVVEDLQGTFPDFESKYMPISSTMPPLFRMEPTDELSSVERVELTGSIVDAYDAPLQPGPSAITVVTTRKPSLWQRIKGMWPW